MSKNGALWGTGDGQFQVPIDIAIDSSGNVYVLDRDNHRIQQFTSDGTFITKWGSLGSGEGQLEDPLAIAVHSGNVYVVDNGGIEGSNPRIQKFTSDGTFITQWGSFGSGDGQFQNPSGITVDSSGNVYVADMDNLRVQKFTSDGTFITQWSYSLEQPDGIALDSAGNVYVADNRHFVSKFTSDGTFITKWGSRGFANGEFQNPDGISVDSSDNVYVADTGNHRIQKFTSDGTFITKWGAEGTGNGQFKHPSDIGVDSPGHIFVVDKYNNRIQVFVWKNYVANPDRPEIVTK